MFNKEVWIEIIETINSNRLRTFLTAFSVAWGIFILIILLGSGQGLSNGAKKQFESDAVNAIWINGGVTTKSFDGFQPGREIKLTNEDYAFIHNQSKENKITVAYDCNRGNRTLKYKNQTGSFFMRSCLPDHHYLENCTIINGRFINNLDIEQYRKVAAIGIPVRDELFKKEDPIGKFISVDGIPFKVIGVFTDPGRGDNERIYIPVSTAQRAFNGQNVVDVIWMSTGKASVESSNLLADKIKHQLAKKYSFDPNDENAIDVHNNTLEFERIMNLLSGIRLFIWIIGIGTLIAGIVGVSNIMMIAVKERTKEIGVRKAIGATPISIIGMIIQESVLITAVAGYIGLISGVFVLQMAQKLIPASDFFLNPGVDLNVALTATLLLVIAGGLAGLFPALRASKIAPVVALRDE